MDGKYVDFYYFGFSEAWAGFLAAFLTLAVFSFLYKDNPIYKFAEYLFIGVATGWYTIQEFNDSLMPNLFNHVAQAFPQGMWNSLAGSGGEIYYFYLLRIGGGILGIMLLLRLVPKLGWLSRWPLALMIGAYAGLRLIGKAEADLVAQIQATLQTSGGKNPIFYLGMEWGAFIKALIVFVGVLCVLIYFFFSFERKGVIKGAARIGILTLMITFGASFGFTVMGRVSLLIGRVQDLIQYSSADYFYGTFVSLVVVVGILAFWEFNNRQLEEEL